MYTNVSFLILDNMMLFSYPALFLLYTSLSLYLFSLSSFNFCARIIIHLSFAKNLAYGVVEGTVGGYVFKKAFIGENVTIGLNVKVPQYCVLAKGTVVTESIPPFTKSFEEDFV